MVKNVPNYSMIYNVESQYRVSAHDNLKLASPQSCAFKIIYALYSQIDIGLFLSK